MPYNGAQIDNNFLNVILENKRGPMIEGCMRFILDGDVILELIQKGFREAQFDVEEYKMLQKKKQIAPNRQSTSFRAE